MNIHNGRLASIAMLMVLCSNSWAQADESDKPLERVQINDTDAIVVDRSTGISWYPHLERLAGKTKAEQRAYIDNLNSARYAGSSQWRFASFAEVRALMDSVTFGFEEETRHRETAYVRSPVRPDRYFEPSYINDEMQQHMFCGRTADEWALREDLDESAEIRFGEANYHFPWFYESEQVMFDDDLNFIADDARAAPPPRQNGKPVTTGGDWGCGAWVVLGSDAAMAP